jgi:nitrite reductase/ring-hydroxylating ferredoxin subunit
VSDEAAAWRVRVPGAARLAETQTQTFAFVTGPPERPRERGGFIIRRHGRLHAYLNQCPHWLVDLDLGEGKFWHPRREVILCQTHAATFDAETGECLAGPCEGASLTKFGVEEAGDDAVVDLQAALFGR